VKSWPAPPVPRLPAGPRPPLRLHDTATGTAVESRPEGGTARLYVCGITPYDATHLGHAATYVAFDILGRAWRDAGHRVRYASNVTDVDPRHQTLTLATDEQQHVAVPADWAARCWRRSRARTREASSRGE